MISTECALLFSWWLQGQVGLQTMCQVEVISDTQWPGVGTCRVVKHEWLKQRGWPCQQRGLLSSAWVDAGLPAHHSFLFTACFSFLLLYFLSSVSPSHYGLIQSQTWSPENQNARDAWLAQLVKCPTLGVGWGHDLMISWVWALPWALCWQCRTCLGFSLSPSLCPLLVLLSLLSLSK